MGWKDIIMIPENAFMTEEEEQNPRSLIDQYGEITMDDITMHTSLYIAEKDRREQDNSMLFHALTSSLMKSHYEKSNMPRCVVAIYLETLYTKKFKHNV